MTKEYKYNTYKEALDAVKGDGGKLRFVRPDLITYEMALEAVKECGLALEHVREDLITLEMALEAVKECGLALEHVPIQLQDYGVIFTALKRTQKPKKFIKDQKAFNDFKDFK
jgi:hypothetical protein